MSRVVQLVIMLIVVSLVIEIALEALTEMMPYLLVGAALIGGAWAGLAIYRRHREF